MYEAFFGLSRRPFCAGIDVHRYCPTPAMETARQTLLRCVDRADGPAIAVGSVGVGKTMLCHLLESDVKDRLAVAHLASGGMTSRVALYQAILHALGLPYRRTEEGEMRLSLIDQFQNHDTFHDGVLLIIDEAHGLSLPLLEELRLLTNLVHDGQMYVRMVLVGDSTLEEQFANPKLESFNQRLSARCYLEAFRHTETSDYILTQISQAGGQIEHIMSDDAISSVQKATCGIPRLINQLCDHAMLMGLAADCRPIDAETVGRAWADLQQLPAPQVTAPCASSSESVIEFGGLDDEETKDIISEAESLEIEVSPSDPIPEVATVTSRASELSRLEMPSASSFGDVINEIVVPEENDDSDNSDLDDAEDEFRPIGIIGPKIAELPDDDLISENTVVDHSIAENPFSEPFEKEEVILDRFVSLNAGLFDGCPRVTGPDSGELAALLAKASIRIGESEEEAARVRAAALQDDQDIMQHLSLNSFSFEAATVASSDRGSDSDDSDLIVIEESEALSSDSPAEVGVQKIDVRKLFANLRRISG